MKAKLTLVLALFISILLFLFTWKLLGTLPVENKELADFNSGQRCEIDSDCGSSGCSGEYCGIDGPATICYRPPEFWKKFEGSECLCLESTCKWAKKRGQIPGLSRLFLFNH